MKVNTEWVNNKLQRKKRDARARGKEFNLSIEDLYRIYTINDGTCDYTGVEMTLGGGGDYSATLERIDNSKGYIKGNVCLVCMQANSIKDSFIDKEYQKFQIDKEFVPMLDSISKLTQEDLNALKLKYLKEEDKVHMSEKLQKEFELSQGEEGKLLVTRTPVVKEDKEEKEVTEKPSAHEDLGIASYFAKFSKTLRSSGLDSTISFQQFKGKYKLSRCQLTKEKLDESNKFILVLDKAGTITKDSVVLVKSDIGLGLLNASESMGLSIRELANLLKGVK